MKGKAQRRANRLERWQHQWYLLVAITMLLILSILLSLCIIVYRYRSSFTPEKWQRAPGRRAFIVSDLLKDHPLVGMEETAVLDLLGRPDMEEAGEGLRIGYALGNVRTVLDAEWLILELDNGAVEGYSITTGFDDKDY